MDWIRENKVLATIVGVILAGVLALGYLLYSAWSSYTEAEAQYLTLGSDIARLKALPLAPTDANLTQKKALVDEYASNVNKLGGALLLLQDTVQPKPTKDTEFQAKLKAKSQEIKKLADAAKIQIPADFAFGFDPYNGAPPPNDVATELAGYLDAVEALVKLCLNCKVTSLDLLERTPIQGEPAPSSSKSKAPVASTVKPGAISDKRQITVMLTLEQNALQSLVARLANPADMPHFMSVRVLRIENETLEGPTRTVSADVTADGVPPPGGAVVGPVDGSADPKATSSDVIRPPAPAAADAQAVFGNERLKAYLEIDLVKFLPAARGVAAAPAR